MAFPPPKTKGNPFAALAGAHGKAKKHHAAKGKKPPAPPAMPFRGLPPAGPKPGMQPEPDGDQMGGPPDMDDDDV